MSPSRESVGAHGSALDLDRLMGDLQRAVERRREEGGYDAELLRADFDELMVGESSAVVLRPRVAYSSKPVVGHLITAWKRFLIRSLSHFLEDATRQANAAFQALTDELDAEREAREALEREVQALELEVRTLHGGAPGQGPSDGAGG